MEMTCGVMCVVFVRVYMCVRVHVAVYLVGMCIISLTSMLSCDYHVTLSCDYHVMLSWMLSCDYHVILSWMLSCDYHVILSCDTIM